MSLYSNIEHDDKKLDDVDALISLRCQEWTKEIKIHFLRYAAECCIIQGRYDDATKVFSYDYESP